MLLQRHSDDRMQGINQWRNLLIKHYLPRYKGELQMTPVAVENHLWSGSGPNMNETNCFSWLNKETQFGGEVFWLDAGWYVPGIWTDFFGNWDPDPTKFPNGLKVLSDAAHAKGMKFLVWFCEQTAQVNSNVQKAHPEWVYNDTFDFSNSDACKWMANHISERITNFGVDIYRHDGGLTWLTVHDTPDRQGITENHAIEGWYAYWDELLTRHPGLMIDNCAGGGRNIDLETTMRSIPLWQSDVQVGQVDINAIPNQLTMDQVQNAGLNFYVPLHATGVWGMDANPYWFRSAATTGVVFNENVTDANFNVAQAKADVDELKSLRELWLGDYYPLTDINLDETKWCAWQFDRPDLGKGFVMVFRRQKCSCSSIDVSLKAVDNKKKYKVKFVDVKTESIMTGAELARLKIEIDILPGSALVLYECVK
jgi:alpha-galactosidase